MSWPVNELVHTTDESIVVEPLVNAAVIHSVEVGVSRDTTGKRSLPSSSRAARPVPP